MSGLITFTCSLLILVFVIIAVHIFFLPVKFTGRIRSSIKDLLMMKIRWGLIRTSVSISAGGIATFYLYSIRVKEFSITDRDDSSGGEGRESGEEEKNEFELEKLVSLIDQAPAFFSQFSFDRLHVDARIGLGDPFETGVLFGILSALKGLLYCPERFELNVVPVFETEAFDIDIEALFRIKRLWRLIPIIIRLIRIGRSGEPGRSRRKERGAASL